MPPSNRLLIQTAPTSGHSKRLFRLLTFNMLFLTFISSGTVCDLWRCTAIFNVHNFPLPAHEWWHGSLLRGGSGTWLEPSIWKGWRDLFATPLSWAVLKIPFLFWPFNLFRRVFWVHMLLFLIITYQVLLLFRFYVTSIVLPFQFSVLALFRAFLRSALTSSYYIFAFIEWICILKAYIYTQRRQISIFLYVWVIDLLAFLYSRSDQTKILYPRYFGNACSAGAFQNYFSQFHLRHTVLVIDYSPSCYSGAHLSPTRIGSVHIFGVKSVDK